MTSPLPNRKRFRLVTTSKISGTSAKASAKPPPKRSKVNHSKEKLSGSKNKIVSGSEQTSDFDNT